MEVGLSGEFQLPENGVLVSAVYSFSHNMGNEELRQLVTLEMEHCAAASALDKLSIVRANENSNTFNYLPGGDFGSVEGYSVIKLHSFSRFSTFLKKSFYFLRFQSANEIDYSANIYYTKMFYLHFNFEFFVIRNLSALAKVSLIEMCFLNCIFSICIKTIQVEISKRVNGNCERGPSSNFKFQDDSLSLEFPETCENGWKMTGITPLEVMLIHF